MYTSSKRNGKQLSGKVVLLLLQVSNLQIVNRRD